MIFKREGMIIKCIHRALFKTQVTKCCTQGNKLKYTLIHTQGEQCEDRDSSQHLVHSAFTYILSLISKDCAQHTLSSHYSFQEHLLFDIFCENCPLNFYVSQLPCNCRHNIYIVIAHERYLTGGDLSNSYPLTFKVILSVSVPLETVTGL